MIKVDFLKIGQAAKRLNVAIPTLRGWCNELEELGVHVLERNNRNERVLYPEDMEIFTYINAQKNKYERHKTLQAISYEIEKEFKCRRKSKHAHFNLSSEWNSNYVELDEIDLSILLDGVTKEIAKVSKIIKDSDKQPKDDTFKYLGKLYAKENALKEIRNKSNKVKETFPPEFDLFYRKRNIREFSRSENCKTCEGTGGKPGEASIKCDECDNGIVEVNTPFGRVAQKCKKCIGKGEYYENYCPDCNGSGIRQ